MVPSIQLEAASRSASGQSNSSSASQKYSSPFSDFFHNPALQNGCESASPAPSEDPPSAFDHSQASQPTPTPASPALLRNRVTKPLNENWGCLTPQPQPNPLTQISVQLSIPVVELGSPGGVACNNETAKAPDVSGPTQVCSGLPDNPRVSAEANPEVLPAMVGMSGVQGDSPTMAARPNRPIPEPDFQTSQSADVSLPQISPSVSPAEVSSESLAGLKAAPNSQKDDLAAPQSLPAVPNAEPSAPAAIPAPDILAASKVALPESAQSGLSSTIVVSPIPVTPPPGSDAVQPTTTPKQNDSPIFSRGAHQAPQNRAQDVASATRKFHFVGGPSIKDDLDAPADAPRPQKIIGGDASTTQPDIASQTDNAVSDKSASSASESISSQAPIPASAPQPVGAAPSVSLNPHPAATVVESAEVTAASPTVTTPVQRAADQSGNLSSGVVPRTQEVSSPATGQVQVARLVQGLTQSEMHIGMRTQAFGNVDVHTVIHDSQVGLTVGSDKGNLRSFLSSELAPLQSALHQHDVHFEGVRYLENSSGTASGFQSGSNHQSRSFHQGTAPLEATLPGDDLENDAQENDINSQVRTTLSVLA